MKFKIEGNVFDSGIIAPKVGNLIFEDFSDIKLEDGEEIANVARDSGFKLVTLGAEKPVKLSGFTHMGIIREVEADAENVWERIKNISNIFNVRSLGNNDWNHVKELLKIYPSNRYSNDSNLKPEQVIIHKLAILKHLAEQFPDYSLGLFSKENELMGFHFLRLFPDTVYLQELLVKPNYRVGFASLQLVKNNLELIIKNTKTKKLATRVYEDNNISINFFTKLGFGKLRKKEYYYHMWI